MRFYTQPPILWAAAALCLLVVRASVRACVTVRRHSPATSSLTDCVNRRSLPLVQFCEVHHIDTDAEYGCT